MSRDEAESLRALVEELRESGQHYRAESSRNGRTLRGIAWFLAVALVLVLMAGRLAGASTGPREMTAGLGP